MQQVPSPRKSSRVNSLFSNLLRNTSTNEVHRRGSATIEKRKSEEKKFDNNGIGDNGRRRDNTSAGSSFGFCSTYHSFSKDIYEETQDDPADVTYRSTKDGVRRSSKRNRVKSKGAAVSSPQRPSPSSMLPRSQSDSDLSTSTSSFVNTFPTPPSSPNYSDKSSASTFATDGGIPSVDYISNVQWRTGIEKDNCSSFKTDTDVFPGHRSVFRRSYSSKQYQMSSLSFKKVLPPSVPSDACHLDFSTPYPSVCVASGTDFVKDFEEDVFAAHHHPAQNMIPLSFPSNALLRQDLEGCMGETTAVGVTTGECRHSTGSSVDSGIASTSSTSSSASSAHCYSTISTKVEKLLSQGIPDEDVLYSWLCEIGFADYYPLFASSGYTMRTIVRMTPEDLTAIGIKQPTHRKKLKTEISKLNISDGLPDYIPGSLREWLKAIQLEVYEDTLLKQGFSTVEDALRLTWEDLEDIGIVRLGHQKRILLAIKRIRDLKAGKLITNTINPSNSISAKVDVHWDQFSPLVTNCSSYQSNHHSLSTFSQGADVMSVMPREMTSHYHQHNHHYPPVSTNVVIPIQVGAGSRRSLENLKVGATTPRRMAVEETSSSVGGGCWGCSHPHYPLQPSVIVRSGCGTLPRPKGIVRPRPIAKIPATFCTPPANRGSIGNEESCVTKQKDLCNRERFSASKSAEALIVNDDECAIHADSDIWLQEDREVDLSRSLISDSNSKHLLEGCLTTAESASSLPFANENAGTIKQRTSRSFQNTEAEESKHEEVKESYVTESAAVNCGRDVVDVQLWNRTDEQKLMKDVAAGHKNSRRSGQQVLSSEGETADNILNDIGSMLANLTFELDAMLDDEESRRLQE